MKVKNILFIIVAVFLIIDFKCFAQEYKSSAILGDSIDEIYKIYNYEGNDFIFISRENNFTKISKFNIESGIVSTLKELKFNCKYCYYYDNKLYILSESDSEDDLLIGEPTTSTIVYVYDLQKKRITSRLALMDHITREEQFSIDYNGRIYYIYKDNSIKSILFNGQDEVTFSLDEPISAINFNKDEEILYSFSSYNYNIAAYGKDGMIISCKNNDYCPHGKTTFLSDNELVDDLNYLYKISEDKAEFKREYQFIPRGKFYNVLKVKDKIVSFNGEDKFYVFDASTHSLLGTILSENNILCAEFNGNLLSICKDKESYSYCILDIDSYEKVEGKLIEENYDLFEFSPVSGVYANVSLDDNYYWTLKLKEGLMIDEFSQIRVVILDINSGNASELTLNNGVYIEGDVIKIIPNDISYNKLFFYNITVSGLCDKIGFPCFINHQLELYYNLLDPEIYFISSDVYNIDYENLLITGVSPGTSVSAFKRNFNVKGYDILISDDKGAAKTSGNIGTGKSISFIKDGKTEYKFDIIIYGDINGSGNISTKDLYTLRSYLLGNLKLSEVFLIAADLNHDGKVDTMDLLCLSEYLSGDYEIIQKQ